MSLLSNIERHQQALRQCCRCPQMLGPVITGQPVASKIMLIGQAPGDREGSLGRPFAWTAGKTLFQWFSAIGLNEETFRQRVYMAAVCRCFPGKKPKGGDRVPNREEIEQCSSWLNAELAMLQPQLVIPVGKLAISQFLQFDKLTEVIGQQITHQTPQAEFDLIPLPHPSGASTWHRTEPGKSLLRQAMMRIEKHPGWIEILR